VEFINTWTDQKVKGTLSFLKYHDGNLAVELYNEEGPYAKLSVNIEGLELPDDEFVAKTYSENEGLVEQFIEKGIFIDTGRVVTVGHAGVQPILEISNNFG
tara:strand:+ start:143 stop:445 length:303 start_codon:yes stop_codon:yes gene_type:complete